MSYSALLTAVKNELAFRLKVDKYNPVMSSVSSRDLQINLEPSPPPYWGKLLFLSIQPGGIDRGPSDIPNDALDELYTILIHVTQRVSHLATDQLDDATILAVTDSLEAATRQIQRILYTYRYDIQDRANTILRGHPFNPQFVEPLLFAGTTQPVYTPPGWFGEEEDPDAEHPDGVFVTLTYDRARRLQTTLQPGGIL